MVTGGLPSNSLNRNKSLSVVSMTGMFHWMAVAKWVASLVLIVGGVLCLLIKSLATAATCISTAMGMMYSLPNSSRINRSDVSSSWPLR